MKNPIKLGLGCALFASLALNVSCEKSQGEEVFENLEQQNALLVEQNFQVIPGQYVVTFKPGTLETPKKPAGTTSYRDALQSSKLSLLSQFSKVGLSTEAVKNVYAYTVEGFSGTLNETQLVQLSQDSRVQSIEQDYLIILAPPPGKGPNKGGDDGGGGSPSQTTPYGITRVNGGGAYTGNGKAYVLDSGVDLDHPDLNVASFGFNAFTSGKDGRSLDDGNGHGTHVAGTIAAIDNNIGVIGVAPGATVVAVKVLSSRGSGSYSGVIAGVDYVGANGSNGDVANMSLGGPISEALDAAVRDASGTVAFALAAGNEAQDANNSSPARANGPNIYTVSAMDSNDNFASFSNFGSAVDYCAPGVGIASTWKSGGYNTISGTSMASPHVAGILLLGNISTSGFVNNDPDGNADPIASN